MKFAFKYPVVQYARSGEYYEAECEHFIVLVKTVEDKVSASTLAAVADAEEAFLLKLQRTPFIALRDGDVVRPICPLDDDGLLWEDLALQPGSMCADGHCVYVHHSSSFVTYVERGGEFLCHSLQQVFSRVFLLPRRLNPAFLPGLRSGRLDKLHEESFLNRILLCRGGRTGYYNAKSMDLKCSF